MNDFIVYKQENESLQINARIFEELPNYETEGTDFHQIFLDLTIAFQAYQANNFIELVCSLCDMVFKDQSHFNNFIMNSDNPLFNFFHQCSEILNNTSDEQKETIIFYFKELIKNISFSNSFSDFKGDLMLVNLYQKISNNVDKYILRIFRKMKLSPEFPISIFRDYYYNTNSFKFIQLFINCMDRSENINALFEEFVLYPAPQMQSFSLFCKTIISFFQHSLDENIFVESQYYDLINSTFQSNFSDEDIGLYFQITARLLDYDEILNKIEPRLLFLILKYKKSKSILVPTMVIIYSLIKKEIGMSSSDFMNKYVDDMVISVLFDNLQNEQFVIRAKSLCLLNLFIDKSFFEVIHHLFQKNENFLKEISQIILDFLSSDHYQTIISALKLAHYVFIYVQKSDDSNIMILLLSLWNDNGICSMVQEYVANKDEISKHAQILSDKIQKSELYLQNLL